MSSIQGELSPSRPVTADEARARVARRAGGSPRAGDRAARKLCLRRLCSSRQARRSSPAPAISAGTTGRSAVFQVSTDDAYVQADNTTIAPKVSGYMARCWSATTSRSRPARCWRGSTIATFAVALDQAEGRCRRPRRRRSPTKQAALDAQQSVIEAARATIARRPGQRRPSPSRTTSATRPWPRPATAAVQNAQQAASRIAAARAAVSRDTAALATAIKQVDVLKAELAAGAGDAGPRRGRAASGRAQPLLHDHRRRRSTASSATARCASANTCRRARS